MRNTPIRDRKFPNNSESPKNIIFCSHQIEEIEGMLTVLKQKLVESLGNSELLKQHMQRKKEQKNFFLRVRNSLMIKHNPTLVVPLVFMLLTSVVSQV